VNKVILSGRLGADPDMRGSVLKLRLATNERRKDKDGNWGDHTEWHSVVVFGKRAEALHRLLSKGMRVLVEGKLRTSSWEKDGQKQYKTEVAADEVELFDGKRDAAPRMPTAHDVTEAAHKLDYDADDMPF
jgi:single-strand DNA-binding protein